MAEEMQQGTTYDEEEAPDKQEDSASPKNKIVIIIVAALILAILFVLFLALKMNKTEDDNTYVDDEYLYPSSYSEDTEYYYEEEPSINYTTFSEEETKNLRMYGYTGDEIEYFAEQGMSYDSLIEASQELQDELAEKTIKKLSKKGSKEYRQLMSMTWLVNKKFTVKKLDMSSEDLDLSYNTKIENVDYVKCEPRGKQLFLRCKLGDGTYVFMDILPERWIQLKKKGNIVITYTLEHYGDARVITDIMEVEQGID